MIAEKETPVDHPEYKPHAGPTPGINIGNSTVRLFRKRSKKPTSVIVWLNSSRITKDSDSSRITKVPIRKDAVKKPRNIKNNIILREMKKFIISAP